MKQMSLVDTVTSMTVNAEGKVDTCKKCSLRKTHYFVPTDSVQGAKVIFVGEAPGETEVKEGRPFVGKTGKRLRGVLDKMLDKYSVANTVSCRPTDATGRNRAPTDGEIGHCFPNVQAAIVNYDLVVLVGGVALSAFFPDMSLGQAVGSVIHKDGKRWLVVYHPSYMDRAQDVELEKEWIKDLSRVEDILEGNEPKFDGNVVDKDVPLDKVMEVLSKEKRLYLDIETNDSLDRFNFKLVSLTIGGENDIFAFSFEDRHVPYINQLLKGKDIVIHNALFDLGMMYQVGVRFYESRIYDTMFMAYLLDEERKRSSFKLKELAKKLLGYKYWHLVQKISEASNDEVYKYNTEDVFVLRELFRYLDYQMTGKMQKLCKEVMSSAIKALCEIETFGLQVDLVKLKEVTEKIKIRLAVVGDELKEYADINWGSPMQVGKLLTELGVMDAKTTKTGRMSISKSSVEDMFVNNEGNTKVQEVLVRYRDFKKLDSLSNTFLEGTFARVGSGGRVRSNYSYVNVVSGRLSSSNPNLQNIPRDGMIRALMIPEVGYKFLEGDLSQIELRVACVLARDAQMLEAYKNGEDLHKRTASLVLRKDPEEITKDERQKAKVVNFGFLYGQSAQSFRQFAKSQYGVELTEQEANEWRQRFFEEYDGLNSWHKRVRDLIADTGSIESPLGRVRRLVTRKECQNEGEFGGYVRQGINSPVQGTASDLCLMIMGTFYDLRYKKYGETDIGRLVMTVHDQLMIEVKEDKVDEIKDLVDDSVAIVQENVRDWFDIPLVLDIKIMDFWGQT